VTVLLTAVGSGRVGSGRLHLRAGVLQTRAADERLLRGERVTEEVAPLLATVHVQPVDGATDEEEAEHAEERADCSSHTHGAESRHAHTSSERISRMHQCTNDTAEPLYDSSA
jgi:hypothetical protein